MKIFLHICCAPCALYPYYRLREQGIVPTGYFYNPNIHPYTEYKKRLDTVKDFSHRAGLEVLYREGTISTNFFPGLREKAETGANSAAG
jgi:predicted adenine nucleotide alpha hydrolase (AANH) superfamily ATPase